MAHPAPGIIFDALDRRGIPRRAHPTRHAWGGGMTLAERQELTGLVAGSPQLADVVEVYERSNGVDLFGLKCPHCDEPHWGLSLLPVSEWAAATARWQADGECASFMEGCSIYAYGQWRVIASLADEGMQLVQFFSGEYQGRQLAGNIFCIGLDGCLGFEEEIAPSLSSLMNEIVDDPAAFFRRLGFGWSVATDDGIFSNTIEQYVADVRGHPDAAPWPPTKQR